MKIRDGESFAGNTTTGCTEIEFTGAIRIRLAYYPVVGTGGLGAVIRQVVSGHSGANNTVVRVAKSAANQAAHVVAAIGTAIVTSADFGD